jgi:hypothetical protein
VQGEIHPGLHNHDSRALKERGQKVPCILRNRCTPLQFRDTLVGLSQVKPPNTLQSSTIMMTCLFASTPCNLQHLNGLRNTKGRFTHSMPCPCRSPAMPCRYRFKTFLSHLTYSAAMYDHSVLLKAKARHGRREMACGLPARVWLLPATTRSSTMTVIRSIPILLTTIHTYDCKEL